jgi:putative component of toxin-antitoxin plasmid stabilization module
MLPSLVIIREYITENGANAFSKWFNRLNSQAAAKIVVALSRMETGNLSNVKWFRGIGARVTGFIWQKMDTN